MELDELIRRLQAMNWGESRPSKVILREGLASEALRTVDAFSIPHQRTGKAFMVELPWETETQKSYVIFADGTSEDLPASAPGGQ